MPVWSIVLLIVIAVLIAALVALTIVGRKLQKKQEANNAQLEAAKQVMSMLVIDKKMMKMKMKIMKKIMTITIKKKMMITMKNQNKI